MHEMVRGVMSPSSSHQINVLLSSANLFVFGFVQGYSTLIVSEMRFTAAHKASGLSYSWYS